jgi:unsaturated chondroitin disaccharide hydrolase
MAWNNEDPQTSVKQTYQEFDVQSAIQCALDTVARNLATFGDGFPGDTTENNVYNLRRARGDFAEGSNYDWTTSFWTGMLWLAYELTVDEKYRQAAEGHIASFVERIEKKIDVETHDLGFLYTLACVAPWRLTGNEEAKQTALAAADQLMGRYFEEAGIIQAWGDLNDPAQRGRAIVDSLLNMPLLYWATEETGDTHYTEAAQRHAGRLRDNMVRPDFTTYHTFYWDPESGLPLKGKTAQGHSDESCWSRGQAWAIYGFLLNYRYTGDESFLKTAQRIADYFLAHLPEDQVVYWDLVFDDNSDEERDSSAAAIAVCGLLELTRWLPEGDDQQRYREAAEKILASLAQNYAPCGHPYSNALLLHGVYDKRTGRGIDEGTLWGDYFYLEALMRFQNPEWQLYW